MWWLVYVSVGNEFSSESAIVTIVMGRRRSGKQAAETFYAFALLMSIIQSLVVVVVIRFV